MDIRQLAIGLFFCCMIAACMSNEQVIDDTQTNSSVGLRMPDFIADVRAIDLESVSASVSINNGVAQTAQKNGESSVWTLQLSLDDFVNRVNTVTVVWQEDYSNQSLVLADFIGTFTVEAEQETVVPVGTYITEGGARFDADLDGISNLVERRDGTDPIEQLPLPGLIDIQAGCFDLGSPDDEPDRRIDEGPQTNICLESFRIGRHEVTYSEYDAYARDQGRPFPDDDGMGRGSRPVNNVNWADATAYAEWLTNRTGRIYRLPTEAEWEFAARAGTQTAFNTGNTITTAQANFGNSESQALEVGSYAPNAWGLFDMHGNVWEWTCSAYTNPYSDAAQTCTSQTAAAHAIRGGSWKNRASLIRSASRGDEDGMDDGVSPQLSAEDFGFRLVQSN